jgi:hypothetical protein
MRTATAASSSNDTEQKMSNEHAGPADYSWAYDTSAIDWEELSWLYRIAPLGDKPPDAPATVFGNSMFTCFAYASGALAGAGQALADGPDCAYIPTWPFTRPIRDAGWARRSSASL